jgi:adenylate cyclase
LRPFSQGWLAHRRPLLPAWVIGAIALLVLLTLWTGVPNVRGFLRERALDHLLPLLIPTTSATPRVSIVDIDHVTLDRFGPWPWPRTRLAELVRAVAAAHPAALGLDILLVGPDRFADSIPGHRTLQGDTALRDALQAVPTVLGFALATPGLETILPATPVLIGGTPSLPGLWRAPGVVGPEPMLAATAQGFGALVAAADPDGPVRRVPLLVLTGSILRPGLALELVRLAEGASAVVLDAAGKVRAGVVVAPPGEDAALRLTQPVPSSWADRTISAAVLLGNPAAAAPLAGRIVLIGVSAPEAGGLRVTPASAATPSVQIQAAAVEALLQGRVAARPSWLGPSELVAASALGALALLLAARLRPATGAVITLILAVIWAGVALTAGRAAGLLADPAGPAAVMLLTFATAAYARFSQEEWRARLLRASFEQHLAPEVVRRIAAEPERLRLQGELRDITSMFTDIEGFTAMSERADAGDLIALLDMYFDIVTRVITEHGGMVDKIIGDAVHAIFNAPFELPEHPRRGIDCALALLAASEIVRRSPLGQRLGLGRTRVGIETGPAIVGDVGGARKLDYTAHGTVVNTAARLEAANKALGSSICIGPGTAARVDAGTLRPIGRIMVRGRSQPVEVFTPAVLPPETDTA